MWYFTWILGVAAALSAGIINVMWYESHDGFIGDGSKQEKNSQ